MTVRSAHRSWILYFGSGRTLLERATGRAPPPDKYLCDDFNDRFLSESRSPPSPFTHEGKSNGAAVRGWLVRAVGQRTRQLCRASIRCLPTQGSLEPPVTEFR